MWERREQASVCSLFYYILERGYPKSLPCYLSPNLARPTLFWYQLFLNFAGLAIRVAPVSFRINISKVSRGCSGWEYLDLKSPATFTSKKLRRKHYGSV